MRQDDILAILRVIDGVMIATRRLPRVCRGAMFIILSRNSSARAMMLRERDALRGERYVAARVARAL